MATTLQSEIDTVPEKTWEIIKTCHKDLLQKYPLLLIRWARIYGRRWNFLYGNSGASIGFNPIKIEINPTLGLCIENGDDFNPEDFKKITAFVRERFENKNA